MKLTTNRRQRIMDLRIKMGLREINSQQECMDYYTQQLGMGVDAARQDYALANKMDKGEFDDDTIVEYINAKVIEEYKQEHTIQISELLNSSIEAQTKALTAINDQLQLLGENEDAMLTNRDFRDIVKLQNDIFKNLTHAIAGLSPNKGPQNQINIQTNGETNNVFFKGLDDTDV